MKKKGLLGFVLIIYMILGGWAIGGHPILARYSEYRALAPIPSLQLSTTQKRKDFIHGLEVYVADHVPARVLLYMVIRTLKFHVFGVYEGEYALDITADGWVFVRGRQAADPTLPLDTAYAEKFSSALKAKIKNYDQQHIRFALIISPNKETIELKQQKFVPEGWQSPGQQLIRELHRQFPKNVPDFVVSFKEAKESGKYFPLYYKTDGHWTPEATRIVADSVLSLWNYEHISPDLLHETQETIVGNRLRRRGIYTQEESLYRELRLPYTQTDAPEALNAFRADDDFLRLYLFPQSKTTETLLIIGDSFANSLHKFFAAHFREIHLFRTNFNNGQDGCYNFRRDWQKVIEIVKPQAVMFVVNEAVIHPQPQEACIFNPELHL